MRTTFRTAAVALTAAVVLPVLPAVVAPTAASAAARPAATAPSSVASLVRDAHAKTAIALAAQRASDTARWTYLASAPDQREANRAAAAYAARDARAKGTIAHLARHRAGLASRVTRAAQLRASRSARTAPAAPAGVWDRLAQCESGGNWRINTGNGYYGGVQFSLSSWRAVGGAGYPHHASRAEQIVRAERLKAKQGWGAWPACTRKLGLR